MRSNLANQVVVGKPLRVNKTEGAVDKKHGNQNLQMHSLQSKRCKHPQCNHPSAVAYMMQFASVAGVERETACNWKLGTVLS